MAAAEVLSKERRPGLARLLLIAVALLFLGLFLVMPLLVVFVQALAKGIGAYLVGISDPLAWTAIRLTLYVAAIAVPCNLVFGGAAAWGIGTFEFRGQRTLITV